VNEIPQHNLWFCISEPGFMFISFTFLCVFECAVSFSFLCVHSFKCWGLYEIDVFYIYFILFFSLHMNFNV
jgi:hypothetical protein